MASAPRPFLFPGRHVPRPSALDRFGTMKIAEAGASAVLLAKGGDGREANEPSDAVRHARDELRR